MTQADGNREVVDVLLADHRDVATLVHELESGQGPPGRRQVAHVVIAELVRHLGRRGGVRLPGGGQGAAETQLPVGRARGHQAVAGNPLSAGRPVPTVRVDGSRPTRRSS
jgi:hypothetical protein